MVVAKVNPACRLMIWAPIWNPSAMNDTAIPTAIPIAASASIHPIMRKMFTEAASTTGHRGASARVKLTDSAIRATSGPALIPGKGTKTNVPATRASVSRNAYRVPASSVSSVPILRDVRENPGGVRDDLFQHPRHQNDKTSEKGGQARKRAEGRILQ